MKALTLRHPWPFAVCHLGKNIENRTWRPGSFQIKAGDRFAIHAGVVPKGGKWEKARDVATEIVYHKAFAQSQVFCQKNSIDRLTMDHILIPGIVATAIYAGIVSSSESCWFEGPFGWLLDDVVVLDSPVPYRGAQGLWEFDSACLYAAKEGA